MFEQDLPGENSAGFNKAGVAVGPAAGDLPDDERVVGLQRPRQELQVARGADPGTAWAPPGGVRTCCSTSARGRTARSARNSPNDCSPSASGWRGTGRPSTAPAAGRSRPSHGASRTVKSSEPAFVYLHVLGKADKITLPRELELVHPLSRSARTTPLTAHAGPGRHGIDLARG